MATFIAVCEPLCFRATPESACSNDSLPGKGPDFSNSLSEFPKSADVAMLAASLKKSAAPAVSVSIIAPEQQQQQTQAQQQLQPQQNPDAIVVEASPMDAYRDLPGYIRGKHYAYSTTVSCGKHSIYLLYGPSNTNEGTVSSSSHSVAITSSVSGKSRHVLAAAAGAPSGKAIDNTSPLAQHNARKRALEEEQQQKMKQRQQQRTMDKATMGTMSSMMPDGNNNNNNNNKSDRNGGDKLDNSATDNNNNGSSGNSVRRELKEDEMVQFAPGDRAWNIMLAQQRFENPGLAKYATPADNEMGQFLQGYIQVHRAKPSMQQLRSVVPLLDEGHESTKKAHRRLLANLPADATSSAGASPDASVNPRLADDAPEPDDEQAEENARRRMAALNPASSASSSPLHFFAHRMKSGDNSPISSIRQELGSSSNNNNNNNNNNGDVSNLPRVAAAASALFSEEKDGLDRNSSNSKPVPFLCRYQSHSGLRVRTRCDAFVSMTHESQREECFTSLRRQALNSVLEGRDFEIRIRRVNAEGFAVPFWLRGRSGTFAEETATINLEREKEEALVRGEIALLDFAADETRSVATTAATAARTGASLRRRSSFAAASRPRRSSLSSNMASAAAAATAAVAKKLQQQTNAAEFKSFVERTFEELKAALESRNVVIGVEKPQREAKEKKPSNNDHSSSASAVSRRNNKTAVKGPNNSVDRAASSVGDGDDSEGGQSAAGPTEIFVTRLGISIAAVTASPSIDIQMPQETSKSSLIKQQQQNQGAGGRNSNSNNSPPATPSSVDERSAFPGDLAVVDLLACSHDAATRAALFGEKCAVRLPDDAERQLPGVTTRQSTAGISAAALLLQQQQQRQRGISGTSVSLPAPSPNLNSSLTLASSSHQQQRLHLDEVSSATSERSHAPSVATTSHQRGGGGGSVASSKSNRQQNNKKISDTLASNSNFRAACSDVIDSKCVVIENIESLRTVLNSAPIRRIYEAASAKSTTSFVITFFATQKCAISPSKFARLRFVFEPSELSLEEYNEPQKQQQQKQQQQKVVPNQNDSFATGQFTMSMVDGLLQMYESHQQKQQADNSGGGGAASAGNNNSEDENNTVVPDEGSTKNLVIASSAQLSQQRQQHRLAAKAGGPPLRCYPVPITHTTTFIASCSLVHNSSSHFVAASNALFSCLAQMHEPISTVVTDCVNPQFDIIDCTNELELEFAKRRGISRHHCQMLQSVKQQLEEFTARRAALEQELCQLQISSSAPAAPLPNHANSSSINISDGAPSTKFSSFLTSPSPLPQQAVASSSATPFFSPSASSPLMQLQLQLLQLNNNHNNSNNGNSFFTSSSAAASGGSASKKVKWMVDQQQQPDALLEKRLKSHQKTRIVRRTELLQQYDAAVEARVRATERLFKAQREVKRLKQQAQHSAVAHDLRLRETDRRNETEVAEFEVAMEGAQRQQMLRELPGGQRGVARAEKLIEEHRKHQQVERSVAALYRPPPTSSLSTRGGAQTPQPATSPSLSSVQQQPLHSFAKQIQQQLKKTNGVSTPLLLIRQPQQQQQQPQQESKFRVNKLLPSRGGGGGGGTADLASSFSGPLSLSGEYVTPSGKRDPYSQHETTDNDGEDEDSDVAELGEYRPGGLKRFLSKLAREKRNARLGSFVAFPKNTSSSDRRRANDEEDDDDAIIPSGKKKRCANGSGGGDGSKSKTPGEKNDAKEGAGENGADGDDDDDDHAAFLDDELGIWSPLARGGGSVASPLPEEAQRLILAVNPAQRVHAPPAPLLKKQKQKKRTSPSRVTDNTNASPSSGAAAASKSHAEQKQRTQQQQVDGGDLLNIPPKPRAITLRDTMLQLGMLLAFCEKFLTDHMPFDHAGADSATAKSLLHQKTPKFARVKSQAPMFHRRYSGDPVMEAQLSRLAKVAEASGCRFFLNAKAQLARDYVLLIDRSRSMLQGRRWKDCEEAVKVLAPHMTSFDPDGITLIFFDHEVVKFDNVTDAKQVAALFKHHPPRGSTRLDLALHVALQDHFGGERGATTILCITDGAPDSKEKVRDVICQATWAMGGPSEVSISIIQIGNVESATAYLQELDDDLVEAAFDIVDTITHADTKSMSFNELVAKSLFD